MKLWKKTEIKAEYEFGYRLIVLNMFSLALLQERSLRRAMAIHIGFLPLRLFIGFNVANRWVL